MLRKLTHRRNGATQGKTRLGSLLLSLPPAFLPQPHPPFPVCPTHSGLPLQQLQRSTHSLKSTSATTTKISQTFHGKFLLSLWKPTPYIPSWLSPFPDLVCLGNHPNTLLHISELLQVPTVLHVWESLSLLYYMFGNARIGAPVSCHLAIVPPHIVFTLLPPFYFIQNQEPKKNKGT